MSEAVACNRRPWYSRGPIWLLPEFWHRPPNEHNCRDWGFSWLTLQVWSAMSPQVSVSVGLCVSMGPHIQVNALYHHVRLSIPLPVGLHILSHRYLWRKGTRKP